MTTLPLRVPLLPRPIIDISHVLAVFAAVTEVLAEADQQATVARKRLSPHSCFFDSVLGARRAVIARV